MKNNKYNIYKIYGNIINVPIGVTTEEIEQIEDKKLTLDYLNTFFKKRGMEATKVVLEEKEDKIFNVNGTSSINLSSDSSFIEIDLLGGRYGDIPRIIFHPEALTDKEITKSYAFTFNDIDMAERVFTEMIRVIRYFQVKESS